jgi:DNA-binding beta-propeller fold protein YncE
MTSARRAKLTLLLTSVAAVGLFAARASMQADAKPTNDVANPYQSIENYFKLPEGRTWGSTSAVDIDKDGKSVWVAERCGANSCLDESRAIKNIPTVLKFDTSGKLVKSFGEGLMVFPHGIYVDRDGNIWVTDGQDNGQRPARGTGGAAGAGAEGRGAAPAGPLPGATKGHQIFKFSPDGKVLMTLGKPGGAVAPECCFQPNDVIVAPNGEIIVALGHGQGKSEIVVFSKDGKSIVKRFGQTGTGPSEFDQPHALAYDSRGRLFVGDRNNNRIQIFDKDLKYVTEYKEFSRPSGIFIDKNDTLYCADSESGSVSRNHDGWKRGIRIGSAKDGKVTAFIPDPETRNRPEFSGTSAAEGVAADSQGNIYGAEVGPKRVMKYTKRSGT